MHKQASIYRRYGVHQFSSYAAMWMGIFAQDWLILSHPSSSGLLLGIISALQFGPSAITSLWAGSLVDRVNPRILQGFVFPLNLITTACLLYTASTQRANLSMLAACALILGLTRVADNIACYTLLSDHLPQQRLPRLNAITDIADNGGGLVGPLIAAVTCTYISINAVFAVNLLLFTAVYLSTLGIDSQRTLPEHVTQLHPTKTSHRTDDTYRKAAHLSHILEVFRYIASTPRLIAILVLVFIFSIPAATNTIILTIFGREHLNLNPHQLGWLLCSFAIGGSLGGTLQYFKSSVASFRYLLQLQFVLACATLLMAAATHFGVYLGVALAAVGCGFMTSLANVQAFGALQVGSDPKMRGRITAVTNIAFGLVSTIAAPVLGSISSNLGAQTGYVLVAGIVCATLPVMAWAASKKTLSEPTLKPAPTTSTALLPQFTAA